MARKESFDIAAYSIEELCERSNFVEMSYLLIYGELPTADELWDFRQGIHDSRPFARRDEEVLRQLSVAGASDGGAFVHGVLAFSVSPQVA